MEIEKKFMDRRNWKRVKQREYVYTTLEEATVSGECSLLHILEVISPSFRQYEDMNVKIVDKGYYWLQIALKDENYWITAMYDEKQQIIQYYIDIIEKNVITNDGNSYFYDLILDIVCVNDKIILLDEDELNQALEENNITQEQYDLAYQTAEKIMKEITEDKSNIQSLCDKYFNLLVNKLDRRNLVE